MNVNKHQFIEWPAGLVHLECITGEEQKLYIVSNNSSRCMEIPMRHSNLLQVVEVARRRRRNGNATKPGPSVSVVG